MAGEDDFELWLGGIGSDKRLTALLRIARLQVTRLGNWRNDPAQACNSA